MRRGRGIEWEVAIVEDWSGQGETLYDGHVRSRLLFFSLFSCTMELDDWNGIHCIAYHAFWNFGPNSIVIRFFKAVGKQNKGIPYFFSLVSSI